MKKRIVLVLSMIAASCTAWAQYSDQADAANKDIMACQYKAALELDDGVSGVNELAPVIADWCQSESDRFYRIMRSKINGPIDERVARNATREKDLQMASRVLLTKRASDRKNSPNSSSDQQKRQSTSTEWATIISDSNESSYMNISALQKTINGVSAWVRVEFKKPMTLPSGKRYSLLLKMSEYDCQGFRYRYLSTNVYDDIGSGISLVSQDQSQGEWKNIIPGSLGETESRMACSRR